MKFMDWDSGYWDGKEAVEHDEQESEMTVEDYKSDLEDDIKLYREGANATEKQSYRSGYMAGVAAALEERQEAKEAEASMRHMNWRASPHQRTLRLR